MSDSSELEGSTSDGWLTSWEKKCLEEWEKEVSLEERAQAEMNRCEQKIWQSFQNSASAISHLYKEGAQQNAVQLWIPFQCAAGAATVLYKDSQEMIRRGFELGLQLGGHRRTREVITWARKRRRQLAREDLVAFVCGNRSAPTSRPHRQPASFGRTASRLSSSGVESSAARFAYGGGRNTAYYGSAELRCDQGPDLTTFKDALAIQGLNGAMSNISVGRRASHACSTLCCGQSQSCHSPRNGSPLHGSPRNGSPLRGSPLRGSYSDDLHSFVVEQFRCHSVGDSRKRGASTDGRGGSESPQGSAYKRNRMDTDDF